MQIPSDQFASLATPGCIQKRVLKEQEWMGRDVACGCTGFLC